MYAERTRQRAGWRNLRNVSTHSTRQPRDSRLSKVLFDETKLDARTRDRHSRSLGGVRVLGNSNREVIMLVLSRKSGERILIGDDVTITVVRIGPNNVRVGIEAPRERSIVREELKNKAPATVAESEPITQPA